MATGSNKMVFADEPSRSKNETKKKSTWKVLIVDDDQEQKNIETSE